MIAGLSLGGALALALAQDHPEVAGVIAVNPLVDLEPLSPLHDGAKALLDAGEDFMTGIGNDVADPEVTELAYAKTPNASVLSLFEHWAPRQQRLAEVTQPVLLMHSEQDHVIPVSSSDVLQAQAGNVERVELQKSFHVATIDLDKDEINRRALDFIAKVTA